MSARSEWRRLSTEFLILSIRAFEIASITKQFLCFLLLQLVEEELLTLDGDLRGEIPAIGHCTHAISVRQILSNTSGIRDLFDLLVLRGQDIETPASDEEVEALLTRQTNLNFVPGSSFVYSNSGFRMLAKLAEQRTAQSLEDLFHTRIFEPLTMRATHLSRRDRNLVPGLACGYIAIDGAVAKARHGLSLDGDAGLVSTVNDLLIWERALPTLRVMGCSLADLLAEPAVFENGARGVYGLGTVAGRWRGARTSGHGGRLPGHLSEIVRLPDHDLSIVVLSNSSDVDPSEIAAMAGEVFLSGALRASLSTDSFRRYFGRYLDRSRDELLELAEGGDAVLVKMHGMTVPLEAETAARGRVSYSVVDRVIAIKSSGLSLIECGQTYPLHRLEDKSPAIRDLDRYVGAFHSEDLEATFNFSRDGDQLRMSITGPFGRTSYALESIEQCLFRALSPSGYWLPYEILVRFVGALDGIKIVTGRTKALSVPRNKNLAVDARGRRRGDMSTRGWR